MGKARRGLWWDSLFSHACCTPEVPVSWACRDSILYRPLGVSCSGHYPERELHLQSEAVFHNVLSPRGSVSVSSMQVFEPGLSSRHVPRMCTRMHTHLTPPLGSKSWHHHTSPLRHRGGQSRPGPCPFEKSPVADGCRHTAKRRLALPAQTVYMLRKLCFPRS